MNKITLAFEQFAGKIAWYTGKPIVFVSALFIIVTWALLGPIFGYSDTWQLVINTGTTIVTFLMVFLMQSSQNRDSKALQLKLDELIFKMHQADNVMIDIEELSALELDELSKRYKTLRTAVESAPDNKAKKKVIREAFQSGDLPKPKPKKQRAKPPQAAKMPKKS